MTWSKVEFLETGDSYFDALEEAFERAKNSILLEFYIFHMDRIGTEILEKVCAAQKWGVKVFMRLDGVGARDDLQKISDFCGRENIELEVFHPLPFESAGSYIPAGFAKADSFFSRWMLINRRTHRKIVIVDEQVAFVGGMNVKEYQSERIDGEKAWHDLSLRLEGPGVEDLLHAFWFRPFRNFAFRTFTFRACLSNYSWRLRQAKNAWISKAIRGAQKRVWIITPYFAPPPAMLYNLRVAARGGVDIRIVLTKKSDVEVSRLAAMGLFRKMIQWGVKLFEYEPTLLHRKLWLIDDIALVGSSNLNHRSFIHDLEIDVILREPQFVEKTASIFAADQANSGKIGLDYLEKLSLREKILSWIAGWFVYWL
jgi:cardiolipin synthase